MALDFNPSQRSAAYSGTAHIDNKPKRSDYYSSNPDSAELLISSMGYDTFQKNGVEGFLNSVIEEANKLPTTREQELFFHDVVNNLYALNNDQIQNNPDATQSSKEAFKEGIEVIEAELTRLVHELPPELPPIGSSRVVERSVDEKINGFIKSFHEPIGSPTSSIKSAAAGVITDAFGEKYQAVDDVVHDGNCGLNACKRAFDKSGVFNSTVERHHLVQVKQETEKFYQFGEASAAVAAGKRTTAPAINFDLAVIFGSLANAKLFLDSKLNQELSKKDLLPETRQNLVAIQQLGARITNLNELFKNTEVLNFIYKSNSSVEFSPNAHKRNDWLTYGDVKANMLSRGYVSVNDGIREDGKEAGSDARTVLTFKHLLTGKEVYIANNSRPLQHTESAKQTEGTHWVCVEKIALSQE